MAGTIFTWVALSIFLFIARSSLITAAVSLSVAVLRLVLSTSEGLPDRWFRPAIDAAGDAFSQVYPGVLFNFQEYYPLSAPCWNASGAFLQSNVYMKVFNYAKGQGTYLPVNAILGPYCSAKVIPAAIAATTNDIAQITGGGESITDVSAYTRLSRTGYAKTYQYKIVLDYLGPQYGWKNYAVIYDLDVPALHSLDYDNFQPVYPKHAGVTVLSLVLDNTNYNGVRPDFCCRDILKPIEPKEVYYVQQSINTQLVAAGHVSRLVFLFMNNALVRRTLLAAAALKMTNGDYVFFALDQMGTDIIPDVPGCGWNIAGDSQNQAAHDAYQVLLVIRVKDYTNDPVYMSNVKAITSKAADDSTYHLAQYGAYTMNYQAGAFYNAVIFLGYLAVNAFLSPTSDFKAYLQTNGPTSPSLGQTLAYYMDYIMRAPYPTGQNIICKEGIAGPFNMSLITSDIQESYTLYAMSNDAYKAYIEYTGLSDTFVVLDTDYKWVGTGSFPANEPRCGFKNDSQTCINELLSEILAGIFVPLLIALCCGLFYVYRRHNMVDLDPSFVAKVTDLRIVHPNHTAELIAEAKRKREAEMAENYSVGPSQANSLSEKLMSPSVGYWKRQAVIVRWSKKRNLQPSAKLAQEVREAHDGSKDNIAKLLGVCLDPGHILLLYEYCSRGSIEESVNDPDSKFEWPLRFSYITDIIRGMYFIHTSSARVHGRLSSACCFIDSRFTVKITDAKLPLFFDLNLVEYWAQKRKVDFFYRQLWTSPEILRERENTIDEVVNTSTREGDAFSFGIVLQEIIVHGPPYCMFDDTYSDQRIYETVVKRPTPGQKAFRPIIDESLAHIDIIQLCERCWAENAAERPTFTQIRVIMKDITKNLGMGDRMNIMESLIQQMEEHTMGLQAMIEDKQKTITEEKARGDFLLYSNLPPAYAELLRAAEPIRPIFFEVVTIGVVDIENFNALVAISAPAEIAQLLADLHFYYLGSVEHFDCILLESLEQRVTIASGVPIRNGILHAREIARLGLTLLYRSNEFVIAHLPFERIHIRLGIHSGPIVSAVVGNRVPRFCLFGETLNVATRIMTVEKPLRIRLSAANRNIIEAFGSFRAFDAGDVQVKGKGRLKTYTLVGEDGNHELMELMHNFGADGLEPAN